MEWGYCRFKIKIMKRFLIFIWSLISVSVLNCESSSGKNVTQLSPEEFQSFLKEGTQLVDVRTPEEFNEDHINYAENINFLSEDFSNSIDELDKEKPVFIYCRSGKRSGKSVADFQKAGFTKIYELEGGILKWKSEGFKTIK